MIDLFTPIVPEDSWHHNFRSLLDESYAPVRKVLTQWAAGFEDRDGKIVREFQTTFNSSFWEIYLFAALKELGIEIDFSYETPDFCCTTPYEKILIEAVISSNPRGAIPEWDSLKEFNTWKDRDVSDLVELASVRLCNSLTSKYKKYKEDYQYLDHVKGSPFILSVSPFEQPHAFSQNIQPIVRVLYGVQSFPVKDGESVSIHVKREKEIIKSKGVTIPVGYFTDDRMKEISAVIFSNTATIGKARALSDDDGIVLFGALRYQKEGVFPKYEVKEKKDYIETILDGLTVFHNPFAESPIDPKTFFSDGVLQYYHDKENGLPLCTASEGALIQRFCIKIKSKGESK